MTNPKRTPKKIPINWSDSNGFSLLHSCALFDAADCAEYLIEKKIDIHKQDRDGLSALHYACNEGAEDLTELLIKSKADITLVNKDMSCKVGGFPIYTCGGMTPLHWACQKMN
eukprot:UN10838